jgi:hypoxanthine phosphoribosyltransferase
MCPVCCRRLIRELINCRGNNLTAEDYACIAKVVAGTVRFNEVIGIPSGGIALAEALRPYTDPEVEKALIVDDVLTTGKSMEEMRAKLTAGKHTTASAYQTYCCKRTCVR